MRLPDVNLLLYALDSRSPHHKRAKRWLEECLSGTETFAFAWIVLLAFLRLSTNPRVFKHPLSADDSFAVIDGWLEQPCSIVVHPSERHSALLRELLARYGTAGNLTSDAHLGALSIEHGATLCSSDADFSRLPGVRWENPLEA